jgi:hypothetical protein
MQKIGGKNGDEARGFIGIKDILNGDGVNKFPTNRLDTNFNPLYSIICLILTIFGHVVGFLNGILNIINGLITSICSVKLPVGLSIKLRYCFNLPAGFEFCNQAIKIIIVEVIAQVVRMIVGIIVTMRVVQHFS